MNIRPVYVACTDADVPDQWAQYEERIAPEVVDENGNIPVARPRNATVDQPKSADRWIALYEGAIDMIAVRSTHCGFMERPDAWSDTFDHALRMSMKG